MNVSARLTSYIIQTAANYSIYARPAMHVYVMANIALSKTLRLSSNGVLELIAALYFSWNDTRLAWNPSHFGRISEINLPTNSVWTPTLALLNVANSDIYVNVTSTVNLVVTSGGQVHWSATKRLVSSCRMDLYYFPFDTQFCNITFTTGELADTNTAAVHLLVDSGVPLVVNGLYSDGDEFYLMNSSTNAGELCSKTICFPSLVVSMTYKRLMAVYWTNLITPLFLIAMLIPFAFFLPGDNNVKVSMCCTLITALYVQLQNIARMLPPGSGLTACALVSTVIVVIGCLSVIAAVMTLRLRYITNNLLYDWASSLRKIFQKRSASVSPSTLNASASNDGDRPAELSTSFDSEKLQVINKMIELLQMQAAFQQSEATRQNEDKKKANDWNAADLFFGVVLFVVFNIILVTTGANVMSKYYDSQ